MMRVFSLCSVYQNKFNIVVSAFTLMELPDKGSRIKAIMDLWKKTENYLVSRC